MTDPLRSPGHTPQRSEPLQPHKPGSGDSQRKTAAPPLEDALGKARVQGGEAQSNVRDDYR